GYRVRNHNMIAGVSVDERAPLRHVFRAPACRRCSPRRRFSWRLHLERAQSPTGRARPRDHRHKRSAMNTAILADGLRRGGRSEARAALSSISHLRPWCAVPTDGSLSADSCRFRRMPMMAALGLVLRASPVHTAMRNCTRDEGGPFEFGNQVPISSHRKLLWSKAMVVNVAEQAEQDFNR